MSAIIEETTAELNQSPARQPPYWG